ncbi:MAG: hypothetical protein WA821_07855 [Anaerolineales bacterium]
MAENILFVCGSLNQTIQMHKIAQHMREYNCYFSSFYAEGIIHLAAQTGLLDFTGLGGRHQNDTREYLTKNNLSIDQRGEGHDYDMVVTCSDLLVQNNIRGKRLVLVQEGITEPEGWVYKLVRTFKLPRYLANTATSGLSDAYDIFCVASQGYHDLFVRKGVKPQKIAVTGIPNFDNLREAYNNTFPCNDFVLVATTPLRESLRFDDRPAFLKKCVRIANGRQLIFKLHPNENANRARYEIEKFAPGSLVLTHGNVNHMIANAAVVITQQSSCTFVAVGLGKEVHTNLDINELRRLMPIQNNGMSAEHIARISRQVLHTPMSVLEQVRAGYRKRPRWEQADLI